MNVVFFICTSVKLHKLAYFMHKAIKQIEEVSWLLIRLSIINSQFEKGFKVWSFISQKCVGLCLKREKFSHQNKYLIKNRVREWKEKESCSHPECREQDRTGWNRLCLHSFTSWMYSGTVTNNDFRSLAISAVMITWY